MPEHQDEDEDGDEDEDRDMAAASKEAGSVDEEGQEGDEVGVSANGCQI